MSAKNVSRVFLGSKNSRVEGYLLMTGIHYSEAPGVFT